MSNKNVGLTKDGSIEVKSSNELFSAALSIPFYSRKRFTFFLMIIFLCCDSVGFYQALKVKSDIPGWQIATIIIGLAAAFEIAPIYIGYALSQKCYGIGIQGLDEEKKKEFPNISTLVLVFSTSACILGIFANTTYRVLILLDSDPDKTKVAIAVVMCAIPVITSLINLSAGCLAFDPLVIDIFNLKNKLNLLRTQKRQIDAKLQELSEFSCDNEQDVLDRFQENFDDELNQKYKEVEMLSERLKSYVRVIIEEVEVDKET